MRIINAHVIDLDADQATGPSTIEIDGPTIAAVSAAATGGGEEIDAGGRFVLPGLVNSHEHLSLKGRLLDPGGNQYYDVYRAPAEQQLLQCARSLLVSLGRGITTVRDAGAAWMVSLKARDAVRNGVLPGPRVYTCGQVLSTPFEGEAVKVAGMTVDAAGVQGVTDRIDELVKQGVDFIKLKGHRRDFADPKHNGYFSPQEIVAAGREAHRHGLKFALHAWHCHVVEPALEAGVVDSVEHGNPLHEQPALLDRMASDGVILVPNMCSWAPGPGARWSRYPDMAGIALEGIWDTVRLAIEKGVTIAAGTDLHNDQLHTELNAYVQLGMSPSQALQTATSNGARLLGLEDEIGRVAEGRRADLVILDDDPRTDLSVLATPWKVVAGGVVHDGAELRRLVATERMP
jgi:imidazolonepropionase-like amidohydrolase